MSAAAGALGQLGIDSASPVTIRFELQNEALVMNETVIDGNGLLGTRSSNISRVRPGIQRIEGPIRMQPDAVVR